MKSAIVTGANGFIGTALVRELTAHGVHVFAVIKDANENINSIISLPGVNIVYCNMDEIEALASKINGHPEIFYHLAWVGTTGKARADHNVQLKNAKWTVDAVEAAKALDCRRFVGAGTLAQYDVNAYSPLNGSTPNPVSIYGVAKNAAQMMSKARCNELCVEHLWGYLTNTYGIGNYTMNFVNFAVKTMVTGKPADFTAGEQMYDFANVRDVVHGLFCIGDKGKANYSYYIGSTRPAKLKEFIRIIRDEINPEIHLNLGALPFNGVNLGYDFFDCTPIIQDTGYEAKVIFREGIKETIPWLRQQIMAGWI